MKAESKSKQTAHTRSNDSPNPQAIKRGLEAAKQSGLLPPGDDDFAMRYILSGLRVPKSCAHAQCRRAGLCLGPGVSCYRRQFRQALYPYFVQHIRPALERMALEKGDDDAPTPLYDGDGGRRQYPPAKNKKARTSPATTAKGGNA